jgi:outer membrane protein OmpA-like peptidoglycan-associated protein
MTERALTPAPASAGAADLDAVRPESPAIQLLDAMRAGDDRAVVAAIGQATTVTAENLQWACRGPDEVDTMLREARERFPGLTFESTTRHVGFGVVVEEARVRDVEVEGEGSKTQAAPRQGEGGDDTHPMWDEPATRPRTTEMVAWGRRGELAVPGPVAQPPIRLNLPVRVTVRHDDLQVYDVRLSFPAALLKRALGEYVDPLEMSLSEVQSAFIAPVGAGLTTHSLAGPEPALTSAPATEPGRRARPTIDASTHRRRRRRLVPLVLVLVALLAAGGWWFAQGNQGSGVATPRQASAAPSVVPSGHASQQAATRPSSSQAPTVTRNQSTATPTRTPNVTLRSDLAFGFNSSTLSPAAKVAIAQVADQVRRAGLTGRIFVAGYTDDIGSAAYGLVLSQRRADAVSAYLQSQLLGVPVSIVSVGHGESDPIVSNATAAGQQQNRRVTITLPRS